MSPLRYFPEKFSKHEKREVLEELITGIKNHEAMKLGEQYVLDNMIRASLVFTTCFYGNLHSSLTHYLGGMHNGSRLAVPSNTKQLHLLLELSRGELATKNIPTKAGNYSPHFVPMLEAAKSAKIKTKKLEHFINLVGKPEWPVRTAAKELGFNLELTEYLSFSDLCTKTYKDSFATVALRELTLPGSFSQILRHLPKYKRYDKYKEFLGMHIEFDNDQHGPLMTQALEDLPDVDRAMDTMIEFYDLRKWVYDSCLREPPIF